ncbi:GtrA family protein [Flavilitoribacter nigricans]|uniref:GtrA/DPMS transmembrane domain-containing protein n=1 Tax=Flavilitoribacter nigricans (strain ATCC 23147 / DSM 23189 / NBRC 102662 / NCIMB 1420 / SS-2) TaxID=1122177 RepID=A0A2D0NJV8_FLAN2|nr:GtrA family protein [Flavilitoribacter nigricans]PHN08023.1 hypothetical protein CRP01_03130 [Flavilitoribacter nigricans DSM 23189 = NBRC 102662]
MINWRESKVSKLFLLKGKYATASLVATLFEYGLYSLFIYAFAFEKTTSHIMSFGIAMIANFLLQRFFVFKLKRPVMKVFAMAMGFSLGGLLLSSLIFSTLVKIPFLEHNHYLAKVMTSGMIFFYNFYLKRFSFEKKFV